MTGCERIKAVLDGQTPDKVPLMLHSFMPAAQEAGFTMAEYRNSPKNIAKTHVDFAQKYDMDGILVDIDTCMEAHAIGVPVDFPEKEPARVTGPASADIDSLIEMMDPDKLAKDERIKISLEAVNLIKNQVGDEILVRGNCDQMAFSLAMLSYGMTDFMADLLDEDMQPKILQLIERAYHVHLTYHKLMKSAGADITSFGDSSCGPDLISRDMYLTYSQPFHKRLQQDLQAEGIQTVCHICGNLDRILQDVADIGFPAIEADYKTDIPRAEKILKGKSALFGPIDPSGVFFFADADTVRRETQKVLDAFGGKNLVLGAGCALPEGTPPENIKAFVETARQYTIQP